MMPPDEALPLLAALAPHFAQLTARHFTIPQTADQAIASSGCSDAAAGASTSAVDFGSSRM